MLPVHTHPADAELMFLCFDVLTTAYYYLCGIGHVHVHGLGLADERASVGRHVDHHLLLDLPHRLVQVLRKETNAPWGRGGRGGRSLTFAALGGGGVVVCFAVPIQCVLLPRMYETTHHISGTQIRNSCTRNPEWRLHAHVIITQPRRDNSIT